MKLRAAAALALLSSATFVAAQDTTQTEIIAQLGNDDELVRVSRQGSVCSLVYAKSDEQGGAAFTFQLGRTSITSQFSMKGPGSLAAHGGNLRLDRMESVPSMHWVMKEERFGKRALPGNDGAMYWASLADLEFDLDDLAETLVFDLVNTTTGEEASIHWGGDAQKQAIAAMRTCISGQEQVWSLQRP